MKKIYFKGLMENDKRETNQKVKDIYGETLRPGLTNKEAAENIRSISFTVETLDKASGIAKKYGISRSAVIRILLENVEL